MARHPYPRHRQRVGPHPQCTPLYTARQGQVRPKGTLLPSGGSNSSNIYPSPYKIYLLPTKQLVLQPRRPLILGSYMDSFTLDFSTLASTLDLEPWTNGHRAPALSNVHRFRAPVTRHWPSAPSTGQWAPPPSIVQ